MDDSFWLQLLKLSLYGRFELIEHEWYRKETQRKHPELFYKYKGVVFRILENILLTHTKTMKLETLAAYK